jgi:acyl carrier protein
MADAAPSGARRSDSIADKVRAIVSRTCGRRAVFDDHDLSRDLRLDGADRVELLMAIELAFRIDFSKTEAGAMSTVGDLIAAVERKSRMAAPVPGDGEPLLEAIKDLAAGAAGAGEAIDVAAAAISLAADYPRAGFTLEEISEAIERAATTAGASIVPGSSRRSA